MPPILASNFTGLLELVIWLWVNMAYAGLLVIGWLLLIFKRTRCAGAVLFKVLFLAGALLVVVGALQIQPMIFHNQRGHVGELLTVGGISLALFLAAYGTRCLLRRSARARQERT